MKECKQLTCNRPSDSWENAMKSELEKMAKGRGQEEGERTSFNPPTLSLLLSSTFVFLRSPFRATVHCPLRLEQASSQWAREFFSNGDARDLQMSIQEHLPFLKAHDHAATIPALALVKRHFFLFSVLLQRKVLFLIMVFHRRSKLVKIFSETFVTKYIYKRDSNTSKRTCMLIYNYLKEENSQEKRKFSNQLILVVPVLNLTYLSLLMDA